MKSNCIGKTILFIAIATTGVLRAAPTETRSEPENVKLFARESQITVDGKTVKVTAVTHPDGERGYSPKKPAGFHFEVVNQLRVPTSIHWHGLILPNLMEGFLFFTQVLIPPGASRRYDFPLKQS